VVAIAITLAALRPRFAAWRRATSEDTEEVGIETA
jgi:hypothetical protein